MNQKRVAFLTSIGAGLEYYDFVVYGMMASYLSALFFPESDQTLSLLKTFGVFAIGYIARPIGGAFFGMLGDFLGRKTSFLAVMFLMAIATFSIGLLPTGFLGACLLVFLRLLQGLSFGAELPGAITVVAENVKREKRGAFLGALMSSVSLGAALASLVLYILSTYFTREEILAGAWRVPFLLGGILAAVSLWIRKHLSETPEFLEQKHTHKKLKEPLLSLLRNYPMQIFKGVGLTAFMSSLVIFAIYTPTYLKEYFHYESSTIYLATIWGLIWSAISVSLCGFIVDRIGKRRAQILTSLAFIVFGYFFFELLNGGTPTHLFIFMAIYQTFISFLTPSLFALLSEIFPTSVRYTGIALCYNITYSLMGCAPLALTYLLKATGNPSAAPLFLAAFALLSMGTCLLINPKYYEIKS